MAQAAAGLPGPKGSPPRSRPSGRGGAAHRLAVLTGGEPLLQADATLVRALHDRGFAVAVETNGTRPAPPGLDWICVSPKAGAALVLQGGDECKLVFPQAGAEPHRYEHLAFQHFPAAADGRAGPGGQYARGGGVLSCSSVVAGELAGAQEYGAKVKNLCSAVAA